MMRAKIWAKDVEDEAIKQIQNVSALPFVFKHIAVMPDVHAGWGSTVGSVIPTQKAIMPAAVGVDIGCGMMALKLPFKIDQIKNLDVLRHSIERSVPVGFSQHKNLEHLDGYYLRPNAFPEEIVADKKLVDKAYYQVGTLGGGNHFIEICHDTEMNAWVMLHSGSRHIGKAIADVYIDKAKKMMEDFFIQLADPNLAYLPENTQEFKDYISALLWAQDYAKLNRKTMMRLILKDISYHLFGENKSQEWLDNCFQVNCHHNYAEIENHFGQNIWVTRKGAVRARIGDYGIIPGSMGQKSYIVKGKGNPDSFCSCSHGAGRRMSRTKAKATFSLDDLIKQTDGVECRKDEAIIDEIPGAYKDIDEVMELQKDLVEVVHILKQVICIKG